MYDENISVRMIIDITSASHIFRLSLPVQDHATPPNPFSSLLFRVCKQLDWHIPIYYSETQHKIDQPSNLPFIYIAV